MWNKEYMPGGSSPVRLHKKEKILSMGQTESEGNSGSSLGQSCLCTALQLSWRSVGPRWGCGHTPAGMAAVSVTSRPPSRVCAHPERKQSERGLCHHAGLGHDLCSTGEGQ